MGAGGRSTIPAPAVKKEKLDDAGVTYYERKIPASKPPFTLNQIKKAVPPHCFERSFLRSFAYVVYDLTLVYILYYAAANYIDLLPKPLKYIAWPLYGYVQGCVFTGIWNLAHDCGHNAFSDYPLINDIIGFILHTGLLVPYYSFKYSHRRHHANTGSMEKEEVFVPRRKSSLQGYVKYFNNPPGRIINIIMTLVLGWPLYTLFNVSGRNYGKFASHYDPYSPIFTDRERVQIFLSDLGILGVCYLMYKAALVKGFAWVFGIYLVPVLVDNAFLVLVTYIQHTHRAIPAYESAEWDWLRGNLATIDRDFGILNKVFHNITDTHVAHHLFPGTPHYHAEEITKAIKPVLGEYYVMDRTPFIKAIYREAKECIYVEAEENDKDNKGVLWYKNKL